MLSPFTLTNGTVLRPQGTLESGAVHIAGEQILAESADGAEVLDCSGLFVLPGIVDVHGDAFETELFPRRGVEMDFALAMGSVDRQLIGNGITTAFHGLTVSWEPGARSIAAARKFMDNLPGLRRSLVADHRVQLRWEVFAHDVIDDVARWLAQKPTPALAFNDHSTETLRAMENGEQASLAKWAERAGVSLTEYMRSAAALSETGPNVEAKIREVAAMGRAAGAMMLGHDEGSPEERDTNRGIGLSVSEFPLHTETARAAVKASEHVVLGGPNVLRGASHKGFMSAEGAVRDGLCTVLASDYYYPSLMHGVEALVQRGIRDLSAAWALISSNPAKAMGLSDRGSLEPGKRADLVLLDTTGPWRIRHVIAGGRLSSFG